MPKISVLHIFGRMHLGGAELRTLDIMRNMNREKFEFAFCVLSGRRGELDEEIKRLGGKIHYLKLNLFFPFKFAYLLKKKKFTIIHSHVFYFSGVILFISRLCNQKKRIVHFRNMKEKTPKNKNKTLRKLYLKLIDLFATDILAVSEGVMNSIWAQKWKKDKRCRVIYNGIDLVHLQKKKPKEDLGSNEDHIYIHIGRMANQKNHLRVFDIFWEIQKKDPWAKLFFVGRKNVNIMRKLNEKINSYNLNERVFFLGERTDVFYLLKNSKLLLFPSLWEGLPGVVIEACAAGTPVLASDLPGINEIKKHLPMVTCLSLKENNKTWAEQALKISDYWRRTNNLEEKGFQFVKQSVFDIQNTVEQLERIWEGS